MRPGEDPAAFTEEIITMIKSAEPERSPTPSELKVT